MEPWRDELSEIDRGRLERLEARGGRVRWQLGQGDAPGQHYVYGFAHGIPVVGAGPMPHPLDPAQRQKAAHDVIERVATVLGVLEG